MTHYSTLGVAENASSDEIKQAYRRLAKQHHPDKGGDTAKFQEIQEAYDVLGDDQKRAQYDQERQGFGPGVRFSFNGGPFGHSHIDDIFSQFGFNPFGDPFAHHRAAQQRRNKDLRIRIIIELKDTLEEQVKTVSVQTTNGDRQEVEVKIPRGVTTGTQIKYSGLGDNLFNTLPRGDLYVQFEVRENPNFEVHGLDLVTHVVVNSLEAIIGCEKVVQGLDGKEFEITIPAGVQYDSKLRLNQQGLYAMQQNLRGNLIVNVKIVTPNVGPHQQQIIKDLLSTL